MTRAAPRPGRSWVVLLRGINVGGRTSVPMARLRAAIEAAGLAPVRSYIQSGNLLVRSALTGRGVESAVARIMADEFGLDVPVLARSAGDWFALAARNPMPAQAAADPGRLMVALTQHAPKAGSLDALRARARAGEEVALGAGGVWIYYPEGAGRSTLGPGLLDRILGSAVTTRNWRTVVKLAEMLREEGAG